MHVTGASSHQINPSMVRHDHNSDVDSDSNVLDTNTVTQATDAVQTDTLENNEQPKNADQGCFAMIKNNLSKCWEGVKSFFETVKNYVMSKLPCFFGKKEDEKANEKEEIASS